MYFNCESIESLGKECSKTIDAIISDLLNGIKAENEVLGTNITTISIPWLVVDTYAVNDCCSNGRVPDCNTMNYIKILAAFNTNHDAYSLVCKQDSPDSPFLKNKDKGRKIIKWVPLFEDTLSRIFGSKGPLVYGIRYVQPTSCL